MSDAIRAACIKVAKTNMFDRGPTDADPMIQYIESICLAAADAHEQFREMGASERDVADAIHYIAQVFAIPPIRDNVEWFADTLLTLLELAFPNGGVDEEAARFANRMILGLQEQMTV